MPDSNGLDKALLDEMQALKKLLILQLLGMGFKQKQIAATLGISDATLSRMLPKGLSKNLPSKNGPIEISSSTDI